MEVEAAREKEKAKACCERSVGIARLLRNGTGSVAKCFGTL